ncbi:protease complex subunit PrcB family protein [Tenacibaculum agarivorans]|uniref:protease complex subunit PrcB family protein n=1 Tax=Tenacibaculum agarivorans TaxID=1908389 RepID=UPI00094BB61A|nr:protease complex subunit PrcB family protein [Tenacibaculum agarivorans]
MKLLSLALTLLFYVSCAQKVVNNTTNEQLVVQNVYQGVMAGMEDGGEKENFVIQSVKEWKVFLAKLDVMYKISEEFETTIDFSKKSVIVAIDSVRNTTGYTIKINEVLSKNKTLDIVIKRTGPKPTDMVGMAITQPIHIITINKTDKKIIFVEE